MTVGINTTNVANAWLNVLRGTTFTGISATYVKLHTGDPGASAAANASAVTTRVAVTHAAASGGAIAITGTNPSFSMTATETITHVSYWDASTAGNFLWSAALTTPKAVANGDTFTLNSSALAITPLAA